MGRVSQGSPFGDLRQVPRRQGAPARRRDDGYFPETGSFRLPGGRGSANAKVILIGEHAVVHGRPAIAAPLTHLRMQAAAMRSRGPIVFESEEFSGLLSELPARVRALQAAVHGALDKFDRPHQDITISVRTGIPPGRGLGSSAAAAHAITEAIRDLYNEELTEDERFDLVQAAERVAHGTPSGLDARVTRASAPIWFRDGQAVEIPSRIDASIVLADTGVRGSTIASVADARAFLTAHPDTADEILSEFETLTTGAADDLSTGRTESLGVRMNRAQELLDTIGVGHESITRLTSAARSAGALGAKLTGGGQGGCVIALVRDDAQIADVVAAMEAAGAVGSWVVPKGVFSR